MKKIFLTIVTCITFIVANAQSNWTFSTGIGFLVAPKTSFSINEISGNDTTIYKFDLNAIGYSFFMYPKYHFVEAQQNSRSKNRRRSTSDDKPYDFSAGIPLMLGFNGVSAGGGNNQVSFMYSLALAGDINFGGCKANSESLMGAYVGVGFGVSNTSSISGKITPLNSTFYKSTNKTVANINDYTPKGLGVGPVIHGGFEYGSNGQNKFGLHIGYQPAVNKNGLNYYIIGLQVPFLRSFGMF